MPLTRKILPNYTYDEYCHWKGNWEVIDGLPYAMTPAPHPKHQRIAARINTILSNSLQNDKCSCAVYHPIDIKIDDYNVVQPDVLIVCDHIEKPYLDFPPALVVEILSPSTRDKDLFTKKELYAGFGIKYYLIIDPDDSSLQIYLLKGGDYQKVEPPYPLEIDDSCVIKPDFTGIFN